MNIIEQSKYRDEAGKISFMERLSATLDYGFGWYARMQAQEVVSNRLARVLGEQHVLLRNVVIPGVDDSMPHMILVGPQGARLVMALPERGVFRAKDDDWLRFDSRARRFKRARPNLQTLSLNLLKRIRHLLEIQSLENFVVEAVLIFTHPRTLIDSARPLTRMVSADAIEYFAANLNQQQSILGPTDIRSVVDAILYPKIPDPEQASAFISAPQKEPLPDFPAAEQAPDFPMAPPFDPDPLTLDQPDRMQPDVVEQPASEFEMPFYPDSFEDFDRESFLSYADDDVLDAPDPTFEEEVSYDPAPRKRRLIDNPKISGTQWIFLAALASIEIVILVVFAYIYFQQ